MANEYFRQGAGHIGTHHGAGIDAVGLLRPRPRSSPVVLRSNRRRGNRDQPKAAEETRRNVLSAQAISLEPESVAPGFRFDQRPEALIRARLSNSPTEVVTRNGPAPEIACATTCCRQSTPLPSAESQRAVSRSRRVMLAAGGSTGVSNRATVEKKARLEQCEQHRPPTSLCCGASRSARSSRDSAETNSPQTLWRGNCPRSSNSTRAPLRAPVMAAEVPAGPPPTTIKSNTLYLFHAMAPIRNTGRRSISTRAAVVRPSISFISRTVYARRTEAGASCRLIRLR